MTEIRIAHSPDADDAHMFYALMNNKIDTEGLHFTDVREDIETLNKKALQGTYEVSAISFHTYPRIIDHYHLLSTGACFGDKYGPVIVAHRKLRPKQLLKVRVGIPGKNTTAFLVMRLYEHHLTGHQRSGICYSELNFDHLMDQVKENKMDAGLIIHEGQLSFTDHGLFKIVDLGEWWFKETKLPLPLGGVVVRKDLEPALQWKIGKIIQKSIEWGLNHPEETLEHSVTYARGLDKDRALQFIKMYVNELTIEMGSRGFLAIKTLFDRAYRENILSSRIFLEDHIVHLDKNPNLIPTEEPLQEASSQTA